MKECTLAPVKTGEMNTVKTCFLDRRPACQAPVREGVFNSVGLGLLFRLPPVVGAP